jgi:soluble lytic murein transglycosylase-like protein
MPYTARQLREMVVNFARKYGIDERIAVRQIQEESNFNPNARSGKGAVGIAQFTDATARRFGLTDRTDPVASLDAWGKYMTFLLRKFDGDYTLALAGYNAGEGAVDKYKGVPPYRETRNYVQKILSGIDDAIFTVTDSPSIVKKLVPRNPAIPQVLLLGVGSVLIVAAIAHLMR